MSLRVVQEPPPDIPHGVVTFHAFEVRKESATSFILGSPTTRKFFEVGPEGARAVELLREGMPWERVPARLLAETGREFDIKPFLRKLSAAGFVRTLGPMQVWDGTPPPAPKPAPRAWRLLRDPRLALPLLAPALVGIVLLARHPEDVPHAGEFLFSADPLLYILAFLALSWALTMGHEGAHYGLARSYGLSSRIRIAIRMQTLVAETDVTQAWKLGKPQRALILAGGLVFNAAVLGWTELAIRFARPSGWTLLLLGILHLANLAQMIFQALLFLKTDGYYLLVALGPERNLRARAFRALRATLAVEGKTCAHCRAGERDAGACALCADGRPATARRRWALASFAAFTIVMSGAFLATGLYYLWNGTRPFAQHLVDLVRYGELARTRVEAAVLLALIAVQLALVLALAARSLWRWQRSARGRNGTADRSSL